MSESLKTSSPRNVSRVVVGIVLVLWLGYTVIQTLFVLDCFGEMWSAILGFLPGIVGVAILLASGFSRQACYLTVRPLSWRGFGVLLAIFVLALAVILPFSVWQGWCWKAALLYAPASGISQELFFRATLLPVLTRFIQRKNAGLMVHAVLFGLWHIGPLFLGAPIWAVIAVMLVPFLSGIGWGWQVQRDRTVLWAMIQHSLIWVIGNQFVVVG